MVGCHATEVLSARQLREAVGLLAATFADDPALHYVFRTGYGRRFVLPRMYRWLLSVARRDGWIVGIQNSDHLGGVAVWLPTTNGLPPAWHRAVVPALSMLPVYLFEPAAAIRVNWQTGFLSVCSNVLTSRASILRLWQCGRICGAMAWELPLCGTALFGRHVGKNASIFIAGRQWLPTTNASGSILSVQEHSKESPTRATECSVPLKSQTTNEIAVSARELLSIKCSASHYSNWRVEG